jgi:Spy/CpxP family protein refolding chaperone
MISRKVFLVLICVLVFPIIGLAQKNAKGPELSRWWERPVVSDLGLSPEQDKQVRAVVRESRDRLIQLRGAVDSAESALSDEMGEEKVDAKKAETAIDRVVTARGELMRAIAQMSLKLRLILTPAQWQELEKREGGQQPPQQRGPQRKDQGGRPPRPDRNPDDRRPDCTLGAYQSARHAYAHKMNLLSV